MILGNYPVLGNHNFQEFIFSHNFHFENLIRLTPFSINYGFLTLLIEHKIYYLDNCELCNVLGIVITPIQLLRKLSLNVC